MNTDLSSCILLYCLLWSVAVLVSAFHISSIMNSLLDYLRESKENRFLEVTGSGRYVPFWKRPPFGFYDVVPYVFGNKDNEDEIAYKHKASFKKAIKLQAIMSASFLVPWVLYFFARRH